MTTPKNTALGYRVLDHILTHPQQHSQDVYYAEGECGTVACFAGWTVLLSGYTLDDGYDGYDPTGKPVEDLDIHDTAAELLGLTKDEAIHLFLETGDTQVSAAVAVTFGPRPADH